MTQAPTDQTHIFDTLRDVLDNATADKVFGKPIIQGDMIVLPVATVGGGGGGGGGTAPVDAEHGNGARTGGSGGGFGLSAKPLGVFVIKEKRVSWRPAVDVNMVVLGGQLVAVTALLVLRAVVKARAARSAGPRGFRRNRAG